MDLPAKVKEALFYMFRSYNPEVSNLSCHSFSDNIIFRKAIRVKYEEDTEIPIFCCNAITRKLQYTIPNKKEAFVPLIKGNTLNYKTAHMIFKYLTRCNTYNGNIDLVRDDKGNDYYGCSGVIFNKDMIPLMMPTIVIGKDGNNHWYIKSINVRVHPCVYSSNGPIEKLIANKIIPYLSLEKEFIDISMPSTISDNVLRNESGCTIPVRISKVEISEDIENFFFSPKVPTEILSDEEINKMLFDNAEAVFNFG
jgi:hypothetical protein